MKICLRQSRKQIRKMKEYRIVYIQIPLDTAFLSLSLAFPLRENLDTGVEPCWIFIHCFSHAFCWPAEWKCEKRAMLTKCRLSQQLWCWKKLGGILVVGFSFVSCTMDTNLKGYFFLLNCWQFSCSSSFLIFTLLFFALFCMTIRCKWVKTHGAGESMPLHPKKKIVKWKLTSLLYFHLHFKNFF